MKTKGYILILTFSILCLLTLTPKVYSESASSREYQVKAAFLYSFINFIDWPKEKLKEDDNEPILIGIIGKDPFGNAFEPIKNKQVKSKKVAVQRFKGFDETKNSVDEIEALGKCHLLYICPSEEENNSQIIEIVKKYSVLTVGDTQSFLDDGGIINFVMEENKVRFEINNSAAEQSKLNIRSKLLRLAKRVIPD